MVAQIIREKHPEVVPAEDENPHGCYFCFGGYVTITVEEDGSERDEAVLCKRCHSKERR